jgi:hypothetical protein
MYNLRGDTEKSKKDRETIHKLEEERKALKQSVKALTSKLVEAETKLLQIESQPSSQNDLSDEDTESQKFYTPQQKSSKSNFKLQNISKFTFSESDGEQNISEITIMTNTGVENNANNLEQIKSKLTKRLTKLNGDYENFTQFIDLLEDEIINLTANETKIMLKYALKQLVVPELYETLKKVNTDTFDNFKKSLSQILFSNLTPSSFKQELEKLKQAKDMNINTFTQKFRKVLNRYESKLPSVMTENEHFKNEIKKLFINNLLPEYRLTAMINRNEDLDIMIRQVLENGDMNITSDPLEEKIDKLLIISSENNNKNQFNRNRNVFDYNNNNKNKNFNNQRNRPQNYKKSSINTNNYRNNYNPNNNYRNNFNSNNNYHSNFNNNNRNNYRNNVRNNNLFRNNSKSNNYNRNNNYNERQNTQSNNGPQTYRQSNNQDYKNTRINMIDENQYDDQPSSSYNNNQNENFHSATRTIRDI